MQAIFFGSIGTLVETSEIQRKAFNAAFEEFGLNWYWNIGNYINMIQKPGGILRIKEYSKLKLKDNEVEKIYDLKIKYFRKYSTNSVKPRKGVLEIINYANKNNIKLGFITTTTKETIEIIKDSLSSFNIEIIEKKLIKIPAPVNKCIKYALITLIFRFEYCFIISK